MERLTDRLDGKAFFHGTYTKTKTQSDNLGRTFGDVAEKLAHYEDLQEAERLVVLPEGYCIKDLAYCASVEHCPSDFGLPSPLHCNHTDCGDCWEAALKGENHEQPGI